MDEKMRDRFETWYKGRYGSTMPRASDGNYLSLGAQSSWTIWQAAFVSGVQAALAKE